MELKKNPTLDLSRQSALFFSIGLIISLLLVVVVFETNSQDQLDKIQLEPLSDEFTETIEIPITEMPPPPPPVIQQPEIVEVPDEQKIEQEIEMNLDVDLKQTNVPSTPVILQQAPVAPPVEEEKDEIFMVVEESPNPEGGMPAFYRYVSQNIKYPSQARKMGIEGKVIVQVVVDKDGSLNEIEILKGIGAGCDEEAIRVLKNAPKWKPGKQRGRPVKVKMTVPLMFKLS